MSQPPSGPPPEGSEPPAYGPSPYGPGQYGPQPYATPQYGSAGYGPAGYGPPPYGQPPYGAPYGPQGPPPPGRSRRGLLVGLVAGFMVLAVCVAVTAVLVLRDDKNPAPVALPAGVTATKAPDGTLTMAKAGVRRPVVDVYEDFQCPICGDFHRTNDATLKSLAGQGQAKVVYHPIVIFSDEPSAGNSLRAAAAAHCVDDGARWLAFQDQLFAHQPPEESPGFSVPDLLAYGRTAGLTGTSFTNCVRKQRYIVQVRQETQAAIGGGVNGTPTVKVNGTTLPTNETLTAEGLRNAVVAAR